MTVEVVIINSMAGWVRAESRTDAIVIRTETADGEVTWRVLGDGDVAAVLTEQVAKRPSSWEKLLTGWDYFLLDGPYPFPDRQHPQRTGTRSGSGGPIRVVE